MDSLTIVSIRAAFGMASFLVRLAKAVLPVALLALPFSWLWRIALTPAVSDLHPIGYWQAFGILVLASIVAASFGGYSGKEEVSR